MALAVGIDIGSTTTKVALLEAGRCLARKAAATGVNGRRAAAALLARALADADRPAAAVQYVVATGYGRRMIPFADHVVSEIAANARGAAWLHQGDPPVRTILDVGGQDSKAIAVDAEGRVKDFAMNDKCAAGTGRFLELMARVLEIGLDEMAALALRSENPQPINSVCAVFAESEVVTRLSQGAAPADLAAGVHASIAKRMAALARRVGAAPAVLFDGGAALNAGLARALQDALGLPVVVPDDPQTVAAVGAALLAAERLERGGPGKGLSDDDLRAAQEPAS